VDEQEHVGMGPALAFLLFAAAAVLGAILVAAVHFWGF
jgi:hypothetical protein